MLAQAQAQRAQGVDVVIGVVETHGRAETAALVGAVPVIPRATSSTAAHVPEFDLDAALARRRAWCWSTSSRNERAGLAPSQALAGRGGAARGRHRRLYDAQRPAPGEPERRGRANHRRRVRETVPDHGIDERRRVVLVDLPPDELLQRLKEGKVYVPEQAERAIEKFFRKGNLTALRELALRRTAERVDARCSSSGAA